jgi:hypothetical protein
METAMLWIKNCNVGGRFSNKLDMSSVVRTAAQHNSLLGPMDKFPMTVIMAGHLNGWLSWLLVLALASALSQLRNGGRRR